MYIVINNKKLPLKEAKTFFENFKGLMLKKDIDYVLKFKCNGIHTFFMRMNIDVILTDKDNNILYVIKNLKRNRIILPKKNVCYTYELKSGLINEEIKKIEIV